MSAIGRLSPGLADPVHDSQRVFRAVLDATSNPGRIVTLPLAAVGPGTISLAATAALLTLADRDTPVWLAPGIDTDALRDFLRFHAGCPIAPGRAGATFGVATAASLDSFDGFEIGTDTYPDRAATVLVEVPALEGGPGTTWRGPGIETARTVAIAGLPDGFWSEWAANHALFPCGLDLLFTSGNRLCGLPRGIAVEA
ncbi:MAG: phosphonate C-P lyase system protein PhnH [Proteobacteria bacterium]|nr:phosphonate C-P lyase system protein PhnH [Pseudomonadota bacterium]